VPPDHRALLAATVAALGGEEREGQITLTDAVANALEQGHHLVAEAPTGSGKSLAYLAPAVASGRRVVVATSTIALQTQLIGRDLPALREHGGMPFTFALLKGRSNYLCLAKLRAATKQDALFEQPVGRDFGRHLVRLQAFAESSDTGDRRDVGDPIADASWAAVSCTSLECPGRNKCTDGDACFAEGARERARDATILVVNHALYCTHLAAGGNVLPEHDALVIDEAHAFADNATNIFGADLAPAALARLAGLLGKAGVEAAKVDAFAQSVKLVDALAADRDGLLDIGSDEHLATALLSAAEKLAAASAKLLRSDSDDARRTARLAAARLEVLRRLSAPAADDVVWVESGRGGKRVRVAPVSAAGALGGVMLEQRPVVAVSATLGGEPPFAPLAARLGFVPGAVPGSWGERDDHGDRHSATGRGYVSLLTPSSFDWREQGILYVGNDLPDPGRARDAWLDAAGERLVRLVNAAGGRALVLCTSRANVDRFAKLLRDETDHDVLAQGDTDVGTLSRTFAEDEASVLVGTRSFWAGIDTPGVSCVLVVIDRIPFPSPAEPLNAARRDRAEAAGHNAFATVDLPEAALVLAQGAGRLIRRRDDKGVVAVLDARLATRDYRKQLLSAMPPFRRSVDLDEACAFLEAATAHVPRHDREAGGVTVEEAVLVRGLAACPTCNAAVGDRCTDSNGTLAFPHEARIAAVHDAARR
jgi:ATP-dependent DNA helicase DinG